MNPHTLNLLLRELFRALMENNLATLQLLTAPNVVCHLQDGPELKGFECIWKLWLELTQRSANRLDVALLDVLVGVHYASIISSVSLGGDYIFIGQLVLVIRLKDGQITESWLFTDAPVRVKATGLRNHDRSTLATNIPNPFGGSG